jgi:hypothetical protein
MSDTAPATRDLTVQQMAADGNVSEDKVRRWCRLGAIEGAWNAGDKVREFWRAPEDAWRQFRESRQTRSAIQEARAYVKAQPKRGEGEYVPVYVGR